MLSDFTVATASPEFLLTSEHTSGHFLPSSELQSHSHPKRLSKPLSDLDPENSQAMPQNFPFSCLSFSPDSYCLTYEMLSADRYWQNLVKIHFTSLSLTSKEQRDWGWGWKSQEQRIKGSLYGVKYETGSLKGSTWCFLTKSSDNRHYCASHFWPSSSGILWW